MVLSTECMRVCSVGGTVAVHSAHATRWFPVSQFITDDSDELLQKLGATALVQAVRLPLPTADERFWSYKLTNHRYYNEHAVVNMSVWVRLAAGGSATEQTSSFVEDVRIAVGVEQAVEGKCQSVHGLMRPHLYKHFGCLLLLAWN